MLSELRIRDLAIIDELDLTFGPGFNVLTGETGAGKSIIIDAVNLLLGDRASQEVVRAGADRTEVEGTFRARPGRRRPPGAVLAENGLEGDQPDLLVLAREVRANGRSVARVNGRAVTTALLGEVGEHLVDVHGQGEHLSLLREREHVGLLDRYAGLEARAQRGWPSWCGGCAGCAATWRACARTSASGRGASTCLTYQVEEIRRRTPRARAKTTSWRRSGAAWPTPSNWPP